MRKTKARPGSNPARPTTHTSAHVTPARANVQPGTYVLEQCPVCGAGFGHATVTFAEHGRTLMNCFKCAAGYESYPHEVAECIGVDVGELLTYPLKHLEPFLNDGRAVGRGSRQASPLPDVTQCHRDLLSGDHHELLHHLTDQRGLRPETLETYQIGMDWGYQTGWHNRGVTFPVYFGGVLSQVVRYRPWLSKRRYVVLKGRGSWPYPAIPKGRAVILVAGVMDALIGRQNQLPTVTMTCGKTLPEDWAMSFGASQRVAVCYDAGEEQSAARSVERLKPYVAAAWVVPLPLPEGGDVADWFVKYGNSRLELLDLIQDTRP